MPVLAVIVLKKASIDAIAIFYAYQKLYPPLNVGGKKVVF